MWFVIFSEGVMALTAKIKVLLVASAFYVLKILVFKECLSLLPAGWDRMMAASQPLSTILDILVHLCLRKKRHLSNREPQPAWGNLTFSFKGTSLLESTPEQLAPCFESLRLVYNKFGSGSTRKLSFP